MAPIIILLALAAAPFVWVVADMWRHEASERRRTAPAADTTPSLVIEHVEPAEAPALAA